MYAADLEKFKHELQQGVEVTRHELSLAFESSNRASNLKTQAYVDFVRGTAGLAVAQKTGDAAKEQESTILVADAKARIAIYGSKDVLMRLATFFEDWSDLASEGGMPAFVDAIQKMREESMSPAEWVSKGAISQMLFSRALRD